MNYCLLAGSAAVHPLITVFTVHSVVTYFRGRVAVFITFVFTMVSRFLLLLF